MKTPLNNLSNRDESAVDALRRNPTGANKLKKAAQDLEPHVQTLNMAAGVSKTLSRPALEEFRTIYKEEFAQELPSDEAHEMALRVLHVISFLLQ